MYKTLTFALVHFTVAFSVAWLLSGDLMIGGLIALIEPMVNTLAYFFHEKAWSRFGRSPKPALDNKGLAV
ncbi:DUF2061 domain-containing protein [Zobellella taiwanensis]|jgi:uncharacterized membrane protein|uniref:DUF2061 domain-containing protein n=1 Tax=Zobellella taiwanensis TaxID=347535 RepID=A0A2P7R5H1_9GAMM|nr:DUF2061 domain-containing protein [Zobellella taiwanensis]PSJ45469.1 hypothetical protein C7I36_05205 [Zobellella taiwanensis]